MAQTVISEEDFDCMASGKDPSPDTNLGSHLPNPLSTSMNVPVRIAPPKNFQRTEPNINVSDSQIRKEIGQVGGTKISGSTDLKRTADSRVPLATAEKRDQINNVAQKEMAMDLAGVTRRRTYDVISRLLGATKWAEVTDKNGNVKFENVPDLEKQRQGAEMALKVMGDMIEHKQVEYGIADSTLEKLKAMSVDTLKARAAELLDGRRKAINITDAVVVKSGDGIQGAT